MGPTGCNGARGRGATNQSSERENDKDLVGVNLKEKQRKEIRRDWWNDKEGGSEAKRIAEIGEIKRDRRQ